MTRHAASHFNARKFVLLTFCDVQRNVDAFFVRRQADLSRINVETGITAIQIETTQGFKVTREFLFLIFTVTDHVPPWHFITQLEA
ncbi:hypothetical protein SRABI106_00386 [Rahnella aquatilis]|nr:hypothetical protein SRABI106_00386 [Rahnella aquatilis]